MGSTSSRKEHSEGGSPASVDAWVTWRVSVCFGGGTGFCLKWKHILSWRGKTHGRSSILEVAKNLFWSCLQVYLSLFLPVSLTYFVDMSIFVQILQLYYCLLAHLFPVGLWALRMVETRVTLRLCFHQKHTVPRIGYTLPTYFLFSGTNDTKKDFKMQWNTQLETIEHLKSKIFMDDEAMIFYYI